MPLIMLCALLAAPLPAQPTTDQAPASRLTSQRASLTLKVVHPQETRAALLEQIEAVGGFPVIVTSQQLQVKVPPAAFNQAFAAIKEAGLVVDQHLERQDRSEQVAQLEAQIRAKQDILERMRALFVAADLGSTLRVEQELMQLVTEIERTKGQLRVLDDQTSWAVIDVSFSFRQRDRIRYEHSPFEWLNTVHLDRFLEAF